MQRIRRGLIYLLFFLMPTQLGMYVFMPWSYIQGIRVDFLAIHITLSLLVVTALVIVSFRDILKKLSPWVFWAYCGIAAINICISIVPWQSAWQWTLWALYALVGVVIVQSRFSLQNALMSIGIATLLQVILVILQFLRGGSVQGLWYYVGERAFSLATPSIAKAIVFDQEVLRSYGSFSHPNSLGGFFALLTITLLLLYRYVQNPISFKKIYSIHAVLAVFLVVMSFSKGALLALFLGSIVLLFQSPKQKKFLFLATLFGLFLSLSAIINFTHMSSAERLNPLSFLPQLISAHPWGVGLGNSIYLWTTYGAHSAIFTPQPLHNIFLILVLEVSVWGLVGLCAGAYLCARAKSHLFPFFAVIITLGCVDHYLLTLPQNMLSVPVFLGLLIHATKKPHRSEASH